MTEFADKILKQAEGKFQSVVVVGIKSDNELDILTTHSQYPVLHWLLNKALFTINIHEMNNKNSTNEPVTEKAKEVIDNV